MCIEFQISPYQKSSLDNFHYIRDDDYKENFIYNLINNL